ncbi:MAG TPA: sigma 54-interacting transcriptional regulator, partial [Thermoanaerobaculia bacterium]|nr:sigma 54-interacting transcriptional regulator [Thermoanaerobaculia bacterium]
GDCRFAGACRQERRSPWDRRPPRQRADDPEKEPAPDLAMPSVTTTRRPPVPAPGRDRARLERLFSEPALALRETSSTRLGADRAIEIVGHAPRMVDMLRKLSKVASYEEPVLIYGESGVGKEALASALHLLGPRRDRPFVSVNCPQFQEGNLTVSELFGHRKGSFTGATADRRGCFETADGGVVFLDEIGDLGMPAQVMLLRAIANGEYRPLGSEQVRKANVRVVSATNRSLNDLVINEQFRNDLLFRLRYFTLEPPPLRDRGDDWLLLVDFFLERLRWRYGVEKRFSDASLAMLEDYRWPGNVRELLGLVTTGYALSEGNLVEPRDFVDRLQQETRGRGDDVEQIYRRLTKSSGDFWRLVHEPFIERDLSRREVRRLVSRGLEDAGGSYRRLLEIWRIPGDLYQKFMDFLRHHRLKPERYDEDESS